MSELVVVIAMCGLSLVLTGLHARSLSRFAASPHDLARLLAAVQRASADFLWQETRLLALLVGVVLAVVAVPVAVLGASRGAHGGVGWNLAASGLGALAGCGIAHFSHWSAARSAQRSLGALRHDRNLAVGVTLRGASALAVAIDAASSLLTCFALVAHYAYLTLVAKVQPGEALALASRSLAALAFGALCAALVFHVGGTSLHTAAGVAATGARVRDRRVASDEERNPVLVAELVGDHVGGVVSRSSDMFAGLLLTNAAVCMLGARVAQSSPAGSVLATIGSWAPGSTLIRFPAGLSLVALPLLIRTTGQFAASVALASARFDGVGGLGRGVPGLLLGARASHAVLQLAGTFGATMWLLGTSAASAWGAAGALGVLAGLLAAAVSMIGLGGGRSAPIGSSRSGATVARAFGLGLQRTWAACALVGACLGGAWMLGARSHLLHGEAFALALAVAALLGASAFDACETLFATFSESVHKLASLRRSQFDESAKQRARDMAKAAAAVGYMGRTQTALGAAAAAVLGALVLPLLGAGGSTAPSWAHPIVLFGALLGAASLSFHVGGMLKASSRTATSLDKDLADRFAREGAEGREASGPLPGYRESVQLVTKSSTEALLPMALGALLAPFLVATSMRLIYGASGGPIIAYGLMAFSALAALTGCAAALVAQGTGLELAEARRAGSPSNPHSLIEFLERCIGPAALLGSRATVVASLAAVPLLI